MIVAIYTKAGKLRAYMDAPPEQIALNVPKGGRFQRLNTDRVPMPGLVASPKRKPKAPRKPKRPDA